MNQFYRNLALWVLIILAMFFLFNTFKTQNVETEEISFTEFMMSVDCGKVRDVTIKGQEISGRYTEASGKQKKVFHTYAPDDPDLVRRIVAGSHCVVVARSGATIVGMGRAISDRASDAWIQDVTVAADFRRRGIASEIVRRLVARLESDGLVWIGLVAERHTAPLYRPLGFHAMADALPMRRLRK